MIIVMEICKFVILPLFFWSSLVDPQQPGSCSSIVWKYFSNDMFVSLAVIRSCFSPSRWQVKPRILALHSLALGIFNWKISVFSVCFPQTGFFNLSQTWLVSAFKKKNYKKIFVGFCPCSLCDSREKRSSCFHKRQKRQQQHPTFEG